MDTVKIPNARTHELHFEEANLQRSERDAKQNWETSIRKCARRRNKDQNTKRISMEPALPEHFGMLNTHVRKTKAGRKSVPSDLIGRAKKKHALFTPPPNRKLRPSLACRFRVFSFFLRFFRGCCAYVFVTQISCFFIPDYYGEQKPKPRQSISIPERGSEENVCIGGCSFSFEFGTSLGSTVCYGPRFASRR